MVPIVPLEDTIRQRPNIVGKTLMNDIHCGLGQSDRDHPLVLGVPGFEEDASVDHFEDTREGDRLKVEA